MPAVDIVHVPFLPSSPRGATPHDFCGFSGVANVHPGRAVVAPRAASHGLRREIADFGREGGRLPSHRVAYSTGRMLVDTFLEELLFQFAALTRTHQGATRQQEFSVV